MLATLLNHLILFAYRTGLVTNNSYCRFLGMVSVAACLLVFGCGQDQQATPVSLRSLPPVCVGVSAAQQSDYRVFDTYESSGKHFLLGYNQHYSTFDLFSISDRVFVSSIALNRDGPSGISDVLGIKVVQADLIWVITLSDFIVYDAGKQVVLARFSLTSLNNKFSLARYAYFFDNHGRLARLNDTLAILQAAHFPLYSGQSNLHLATLNVKNGKVDELPIKLPVWVNGQQHFGGLNVLQYAVFAQKVYYSFPFSDSLYAYDIDKEELMAAKQLDSPALPTVFPFYQGDGKMESIIGHSSGSSYYMGFQPLRNRPDLKYRFSIVASENQPVTFTTYLELFQEDLLIGNHEIGQWSKTRSFSVQDTIFLFREGINEQQLCFEQVLLPQQ